MARRRGGGRRHSMRRRSWDESKHPRDDRGRFSRTPGRRWVGSVLGQLERQGRITHPGYEGTGPGRGGELLVETEDTTPAHIRTLEDEQRAELARWRRDARRPGRGTPQPNPTARQRLMAEAQAVIDQRTAELARERRLARRRARRAAPDDPTYWDVHVQYSQRVRTAERYLQLAQQDLEGWRNYSDPDLDRVPDWPPPPVPLAQEMDPDRPLAIYGDMLHTSGGDNDHAHLAAVERSMPPEVHRLLARYMAQSDGGGIWVGGVPVSQLGHMRGQPSEMEPTQWDTRTSWDQVGGVIYWDRRAVLVGDVRDQRRRSAMNHELGHALDHAAGWADPDFGHGDRLSGRPEWRRLYDTAVAEAEDLGRPLNPYFLQPGNRGAEEFFAEAYSEWTRGNEYGREVLGLGDEDHYGSWRIADAFGLMTSTGEHVGAYFQALTDRIVSGELQ